MNINETLPQSPQFPLSQVTPKATGGMLTYLILKRKSKIQEDCPAGKSSYSIQFLRDRGGEGLQHAFANPHLPLEEAKFLG